MPPFIQSAIGKQIDLLNHADLCTTPGNGLINSEEIGICKDYINE